jgi:hypothetical protein
MEDFIEMGNDELILYIRKHHPDCNINNQTLGRQIFQWLENHAEARQVPGRYDQPCYWGNEGPFISPTRLPYQASAFCFRRSMLPDLYTELDRLGERIA